MSRLLAIASGGGHWIQLQRLRPAFSGFETVWVSMFPNYAAMVPGERYYSIPDASRLNLLAFIPVFLRAVAIIARERPQVIVTTGSAPMLIFLLLGRLIGARTLWIDSIANSERLSGSGRIARRIAQCTLSQWPEVADRENVAYWGAVL